VYPANPPMTGVNNLIDQPCQNAASGVYGGALSGGSLGTLDEHGGMTLVYSLDPSSNAVDAGLNRCPGPSGFRLPRDQRNVRRPQGAACDIGAFEVTQP
ncbi:MAG: choice-of-anchor Q domain-containing protein, partial [Myxococcota bacterium]